MIGIITLLLVVAIGLLITRIATVALTFTGLSKDLARFQARSAFTTCGFTTTESERLVEHPVRRRIIMLLMLLGNGAVVMAISSLIPIFLEAGGRDDTVFTLAVRLSLLSAGLILLWLIAMSKWIDDRLFTIIGWALERFTSLDIRDYHSLLHLSEGFAVNEFTVDADDWVLGKALYQLRLPDEGIQVLGIRKANGDYVGTPTGRTLVREGDTLLLYGHYGDLEELERRRSDRSGDEAHEQRAREQQLFMHQQEQTERLRMKHEGQEDAFPDCYNLLSLPEGFSVTEITLHKGDWAVGRSLADLRLADEGLQVLAIRRADGEFVASVVGDTVIRNGDTALVYGKSEDAIALEKRPAGPKGDAEHANRVLAIRERDPAKAEPSQ